MRIKQSGLVASLIVIILLLCVVIAALVYQNTMLATSNFYVKKNLERQAPLEDEDIARE